METNVKDTTLTSFTLDSVCVIGWNCKIHKHKHIEHIDYVSSKVVSFDFDVTNTSLNPNNNYYLLESGQLLYTEKIKDDSILYVENNTFRESDTMTMGNFIPVSNINYRKASEFIVIHEKDTSIVNNHIDNAAMDVVSSMMMLFTFIYLLRSYSHWYDFIVKIKSCFN